LDAVAKYFFKSNSTCSWMILFSMVRESSDIIEKMENSSVSLNIGIFLFLLKWSIIKLWAIRMTQGRNLPSSLYDCDFKVLITFIKVSWNISFEMSLSEIFE
jgi:hypothetical protein